MKVWITKYALTRGILAAEASHAGGVIATVKRGEHFFRHSTLFFNSEWHRTRESALTRAEEMRAKKLASLRKQIDRLEKLNFGEAA